MTDTTEQVPFGFRISQLAEQRPDEVAIVAVDTEDRETATTWRQLDLGSNRLAHWLTRRGFGASTMLMLSIGNCAEHYMAALAAWKLGACVLPVSYRMPDVEFEGITGLVAKRFVLSERPGADAGLAEVRAAISDASLSEAPPPWTVAHPGKAIGSGGSTGRSKIIVQPGPWARIPGDLSDMVSIGFRSNMVQLVGGPLYHNSPFTWSHYGLFEGHRLVVMEKFDAAHALRLMERHRVSFAFLAPTMMQRIARLPEVSPRRLSSIVSIFHTAAPCPAWAKQAWIDLIGAERVYEGYGSTEAAGRTAIRGDEWLRHPGSVGRPIGCDLAIRGEDGRDLPPGEVGEVLFRPHPADTETYYYIGSPPAKKTADGYISVGDMGSIDADGYLTIADRRVDLIISGGANVYPAEVEAALTQLPEIADAAVIGLPDPDWGRRVHAIILAADGVTVDTAAVVAALKQRLSPYKVPKTFEIVDEFPRDQSGKIRRLALVQAREAGTGAAA
jgi:bile acid-coenzyme A ligase